MTISKFAPDIDDAIALLHLVQECFAYMAPRIDPPSSMHQLTCDTIRKHARDHDILTIGAPVEGCLFLTFFPDHVYLGKLAISPQHRHQGHARALIDHARDIAANRVLAWLELQVRIELTENHRFFEKMGFVKVAETAHAGYDRPTSFTYRRPV